MIKVESVSHETGHKLKIRLSNGNEGLFDISPYLDKGIFVELKNIDYLKQVKVDAFGGICWPNEQDFSADTIQEKLTR